MENNKSNSPNLITPDDIPKGRADLRLVKVTPIIEMPDSIRNPEGISIPVREMGSAATRVVVTHAGRVVSRLASEGRSGIAPVSRDKPFGDTERPAQIDSEEV